MELLTNINKKEREVKFASILELDINDADRLSHALIDIAGSVNEIYINILPAIFKINEKDKLAEALWNIKEEFRHIDYHIRYAELTDLFYVKKERNED